MSGIPWRQRSHDLRPNARGGAATARRAAGLAGPAGKPGRRNRAPDWRVCRHRGAARRSSRCRRRSWCRPCRISPSRSARQPSNGRVAADRRRDGGEAGCVPHRPRGAGEIRHRHARACARGRSDGRAYKVSWLEAVVGRADQEGCRRSFSPIWCWAKTWCRNSSRKTCTSENLAAARAAAAR